MKSYLSTTSFHLYLTFGFLLKITSVLIFLTFTSNSQQPIEEWTRRFNWSTYSGGLGIQLDSIGNVYVLMRLSNPGTSNDYGLAKYNTIGELLWSVNYNSPGNLNDLPKTFFVSKSGDSYITGTSTSSFESHILTVKYSSAGILQWAKVYDGGGPGDVPNDLVLDNTNSVLVVGNTSVSNDSIKALTIKYDANGDTLWVRKFNQLPDDSGNDKIITDNFNNIYIIGSYGYHINLPDYLILKYDSNGIIQWHSLYNTSQNYQDLGRLIDIDNTGNIYVIGTSSIPSESVNCNLLKLNNSGTIQWARVFRGITGNGNCETSPTGFVVSSDNTSVYFTVSCYSNPALTEIVTVKYSSSGDSVWTKRYWGGVNGGANKPSALKLDADDNIYITGVSNNSTSGDDFVTIKYLSDGTQKWLATFNGPLPDSFDRSSGITIDNNFNVYITGPSSYFNGNPILWETATIKYSQVLGIVSNGNVIPRTYELYQNYPNPFNSTTLINYYLPKTSYINISVYDLSGKLFKKIVDKKQDQGYYTVKFNMENTASGIYLYTLTANNNILTTKKLVLIK